VGYQTVSAMPISRRGNDTVVATNSNRSSCGVRAARQLHPLYGILRRRASLARFINRIAMAYANAAFTARRHNRGAINFGKSPRRRVCRFPPPIQETILGCPYISPRPDEAGTVRRAIGGAKFRVPGVDRVASSGVIGNEETRRGNPPRREQVDGDIDLAGAPRRSSLSLSLSLSFVVSYRSCGGNEFISAPPSPARGAHIYAYACIRAYTSSPLPPS